MLLFFLSEKGVIFGAPLTEEGIAQIYQLIEYLGKSKRFSHIVLCFFTPFLPDLYCANKITCNCLKLLLLHPEVLLNWTVFQLLFLLKAIHLRIFLDHKWPRKKSRQALNQEGEWIIYSKAGGFSFMCQTYMWRACSVCRGTASDSRR